MKCVQKWRKRLFNAFVGWALPTLQSGDTMKKIPFTFWQDVEFFIGFLNDYPDYQTQGYTKAELIENLTDLLKDIQSEQIPYIRKEVTN